MPSGQALTRSAEVGTRRIDIPLPNVFPIRNGSVGTVRGSLVVDSDRIVVLVAVGATAGASVGRAVASGSGSTTAMTIGSGSGADAGAGLPSSAAQATVRLAATSAIARCATRRLVTRERARM